MRDKNIYNLTYKASGENGETYCRWVIARDFIAATKKAKKWLAEETRKTSGKLRIDKLEYEGCIDIF